MIDTICSYPQQMVMGGAALIGALISAGMSIYENSKFDLIDLDPFGSAFDCFDLSIEMARKGLIITLGEIGHKRWKRLDFVRRHYDITSLDDFTSENIVKEIIKIGERNKKKLTPIFLNNYRNISRVYFKIEKLYQ